MGADKLKVVVSGLGDWGRKTLDAIASVQSIELLGTGDTSSIARENCSQSDLASFFTDQRHMIQQLKPDAVIITTPPAAALELSRIAVKAGADIIRAAPPARTLDEATELRTLLQNKGRRMEILQPRLFMPSYQRMMDSYKLCGGIFLARCELMFNWGGGLHWRADHDTAGGGVLLEAGFQLLDIILRTLGLPEEVYAVTGRQGRPHMLETEEGLMPQGIYDTDDTAVVSLRYPSGAAASLVCSWVTSPAVERICLHGRSGVIQADGENYTFMSPDGLTIDAVKTDGQATGAIATQLDEISQSWLREPDAANQTHGSCTRNTRHTRHTRHTCDTRNSAGEAAPCYLAAMAVLEAAYLSDRTGQNESPWRLLEARGIDPSSVLTCHCQANRLDDHIETDGNDG